MVRSQILAPFPTVSQLAEFVGGKIVGDPSIVIFGLSTFQKAREGDLCFLNNSRYLSECLASKASAYIVEEKFLSDLQGRTCIQTKDASWTFSQIADKYIPSSRASLEGISERAFVHKGALIGKNVVVGPYVVIEDGVVIGDNSVIEAGTFIGGTDTQIGSDCHLYPNVTVRENTSIGDRVIVHSGTVIGSDGFGFFLQKGKHLKIKQIGGVFIGNDVEIGANVCVDRARFDNTIIGDGSKIDNQVQVGHNVSIGKDCIIAGQTGLAGSSVLEDNVTLGGQVGVIGHIKIAKNTVVGAKAGVTKTLKKSGVYSGMPVLPTSKHRKQKVLQRNLPELYKKLNDLMQRVCQLEDCPSA